MFFVSAFTLTTALVAGVSYFFVSYAQGVAQQRLVDGLKQAERQSAIAMRGEAERTLIEVTADALTFRDFIERITPVKLDAAILEGAMLDFMESHRTYDQIRLIDFSGVEVVRVQNIAGGAIAVAGDDLQDKSASAYFRRAETLDESQVLISQLEPNRENGEIEVPIKPVIRIIVRVPDQGYLVLNYLARHLLDSMDSIGRAGLGRPLLVGQLGIEALAALRSETAEAFMATVSGQRFPDRFPDAWRTMNASTQSAIDDGFGGIMVFDRLFPSELRRTETFLQDVSWTLPTDSVSNSQGGWFVISHIDAAALQSISSIGLGQSSTTLGVYGALIVAIGLFLASWLTRQRSQAARLKVLASRDSLTNLFNKGEFEDRLEAVIQHSKRFDRYSALLFIDLDNFKQINDSMGHAVGDDLLLHVANMLKHTLRNSDVIGRVGGDEFAVILTEVNNAEDTDKVIENLRDHLCRKVILGGKSLTISASIGGANFPDDGTTMAGLYEQADLAMYRDKMKQRDEAVVEQQHAPALSGL